MRTLVWFRGKDLRVSDHAPLTDAAAKGEVACLFVLDPYFFAPERARQLPHRMQFLLESIDSLGKDLEQLGARLVLLQGKSVEVVPRVAEAWRVDRVVAQRWTEPFARTRDERVAHGLRVPFELFEGETLAPPGALRTQAGGAYAVFTPFARAHRASVEIAPPLAAPRALQAIRTETGVSLPTLEGLGIAPNANLLPGGERAARQRLAHFLKVAGPRYHQERDRLDVASTSRISQDLKFGTLSPRMVWSAARRALERAHPDAWERFSTELLWREFTHAVLWDDPTLLTHPRRAEFERIPWSKDERAWMAWRNGETGYPVIDAAARQLLTEGFVPNRARMITASFLVKDLLFDYRRGEAHYMTFLTDGDWAQNNFGWQWSAGCGFDAQPYFRVFNPVEQGRRFDPDGAYVKKWLPELARLPAKFVHAPWEAPDEVLRAAGVVLGKTYARPIVDHAEARARFLSLAKEALRAG